MKMKGERKISALTAYDATFARLVDRAGVDLVLVGDSLGMVIGGHQTTLPVRMEHVVYHTRAVASNLERALLVADLPFLSYQTGVRDAMLNAGRLLQEGGAEAVKLEGGAPVMESVEAMVEAGIPVMGHLGLTPQSIHRFGGYKLQGKAPAAQEQMKQDAKALADAGCFSIVLEKIPRKLAAEITAAIDIPTVGIGAGPECDGQILVLYDMLGLDERFKPRFVKNYLDGSSLIGHAVEEYVSEVRQGVFPDTAHSFGKMPGVTAPRGKTHAVSHQNE